MFRIDRQLVAHFDLVLLVLICLVCAMSFLNLYSASPVGHGTPAYVKQGYFLLLCLFVCIVVVCLDYHQLRFLSYPLYCLALLLLLYVLFGGDSAGGAQRWIDLKFFKLQASEPTKLVLVIVLASYFSRVEIHDGYPLKWMALPLVFAVLPAALIFLQPDLGTALMLMIIFISMAVFVKMKPSVYVVFGSIGLMSCVYAWEYLLQPYQKQRMQTFFHQDQDLHAHGHQILQSKIAVGSGGQFGRGYMEGTQSHLLFLPERHTDFAFSVLGEEWGFAGSLVFLVTYFSLLIWGLVVAMEAKDRFGVLLAFGVVFLIFWQAVINLLMVLGWLPVVGMPMPLVSYGGSSLVTTMVGLAILINVRMRRF